MIGVLAVDLGDERALFHILFLFLLLILCLPQLFHLGVVVQPVHDGSLLSFGRRAS